MGCIEDAVEKVREFHKAFNHPYPDKITKLDDQRKKIRTAWIQEEINEFLLSDNIVEDIDALIDCLYFVIGTIVEENCSKQTEEGINKFIRED